MTRRYPRITLFLNPVLLTELNIFASGNRSQFVREAIAAHLAKLKKRETPAA